MLFSFAKSNADFPANILAKAYNTYLGALEEDQSKNKVYCSNVIQRRIL
jgi:hypothetical protein